MADWTEPVRLEYAVGRQWSVGEDSGESSFVRAKVKHLDPVGDVSFHYRAADGTWADASLNYEASYFGVDTFADPQAPFTDEFALSYRAGGTTWWDDNGGRNYRLGNLESAVGGSVMLRSAQLIAWSAGQGSLSGTLFVENLSYRKSAGLRMSTDDGRSWTDVPASYAGPATYGGPAGPVERWTFSTTGFASHTVLAAAYYRNEETGEWFWDNNFGQNYLITGTIG